MLETRIPPPIVTLAIGLCMALLTPDFPRSPWQMLLAAGLFLLAGCFGLPAFRAFRQARTTIDPVHVDRASQLVTTGIFAVSRNPMYVGLTLLLAALAAWLGGPFVWAGPLLLLLWLDRFQIRPEERAMQRRFGDAYADYKARVRRWL